MIIRDITKEFFSRLKGRILIMCVMDVDAICSCKILQCLLESYNLQYILAPVESEESFRRSFEEYRSSSDSVILINFGNSINIPLILRPSESLRFYVIDSHRPINIYNYYQNRQVKIYINKDEEELNIPSKSKLFLKNDAGEEHEEDEQTFALLNADARELSNEQLEKRRELREWIVKKQKLMFEYEEFQYYKRSVSIIMYELACHLAKNNNFLLWLSIVGLTSQLKSNKISQEDFEYEVKYVLRHISRNQISSKHAKGGGWKIEWSEDIDLDLYRKRTLYDSFWYTPLTVCRFQLWNDKGQRNLAEFLVECGLKTEQCIREYKTMELEFKTDLFERVKLVCLGDKQYKYNLQDLITGAFIMSRGFNHRNVSSACDMVFSLRALLESHDATLTRTEKFVRAIESLSQDDFIMLEQGFGLAHLQSKSMFEQIKAVINNMKVMDDGIFLHVDLIEHSNISQDFANGNSLVSFARFLLEAYVSSKTTRLARRAVRLPLILICPDFYQTEQVLIVGVPPVAQVSKKNFFGKAFEQAAADIECEIRADLSETNLIKTSIHNKDPLLNHMRSLLG